MAKQRTGLRRSALLVAAAFSVAVPGCGPNGGAGTEGSLRGSHLEVLAVWSGTEQERFARVLDEFSRRTGAVISYTSAGHGVPDALNARIAAGDPPDVAFLPQPGVLADYARALHLVPLDNLVGDVVERNYPAAWRQLGSVDGRLYGVWFKAANKSLVWYNVAPFERLGLVPPTTLEGLASAADELATAGVVPFSVAGADAWTLTDWFENLYLGLAGPELYDRLARHDLPWTDSSVVVTLRLLGRLLRPDRIAGGVAGALQTTFDASVVQAFGPPKAGAMVVEGDFVAGFANRVPGLEIGTDVDVFPFPGNGSGTPSVVGGGDAAVLLRRSRAGVALLRYLAEPDAAAIWSVQGGFISPNVNVDLAVYPDEITRSIARSLLDAGDQFRFDLSDLQPAAFGGRKDSGLRKELADFLATGDAEGTAARLEGGAAAAHGGA